MMTRTEVAAKYGTTDDEELDYAVAWEADHSIGYEPINHHSRRLTPEQCRMQDELENEGN